MITPSFAITATERVLPKLALDFTTASLDPRVTFTRTGNTATVVNSSGYIVGINADLPRFDFDPVTLACKGLLIEEVRANILKYNNDFTTGVSGWASSATLTAAATTGPDNTSSATKIVRAGASYTYLQISTTAGLYTFSVYLKANNTSACVLTNGDLAGTLGATGTVNLVAKTINVANIGATTGSTGTITDAGNGWFRCTVTTTLTTTAASIVNIGSSGAIDIFVDFPQMEAGAFATSYIPNNTSGTTTRNADVATMTGANFSDWYSAGVGGVVARVLPSTVSSTRPAFQFDDTTANEVITLQGNTTNPELVIVDGGSPQAQIDAGTIAANTVYNLGAAWNTDNCAAAVNGNAAVTDNTATIPTVTQARLGSNGTNYLNGHIQTIRYWPQRIINTEVQAFSK